MSEQMQAETVERIKHMLVGEADASLRRTARRRKGIAGLVAFALAGALSGGAVAAAASGSLEQRIEAPVAPDLTATDSAAPADTSTRADIGESQSYQGKGPTEIELPPAPVGATDLSIAFSCFTVGNYTVGLDASGNNAGLSCDEPAVIALDIPVAGTTTLYIAAPSDGSFGVVAQYVSKQESAWQVNAAGQTFGATHEDGSQPDLVLTYGEGTDGKPKYGYVERTLLETASPATPEDAAAQVEPEREGVPLLESDGVTVIGVFYLYR